MKASDVMTRQVITVGEGAPIAEALDLMPGKAISGLPVVDGNNVLVGMITEGDLLRRAELATARPIGWGKKLVMGPWYSAREYVRSHARTVGSVMTRETLCISEDTPLAQVVEIMERGRVKPVPVLRGGSVVGIVSRRDLLRPLATLIGRPLVGVAGDNDILVRINKELASQPWRPRYNIAITVKDGIVVLTGAVSGREQQDALHVLVQDVPGVREIRDQLVVLDPYLATTILPA